MKIDKIEVFHIRRQLKAAMRISRGGFQTREHAIVRITTESGVTGLGEGVGHARRIVAILAAGMAEKSLGLRIDQAEVLKRALIDGEVYFERCGSAICAASALEMACWDALGKACGVPAYAILGGRVHDHFEAYASDIYWDADPDVLARRAAGLLEAGFRAVKAHLGCASPADETQRVATLRKAIGPQTPLMIDLNAGYTRAQAAEALRRWEDYQLFWLEEPLHPDDRQGLQDLRARSAIPLAAGENWFTAADFQEPISATAVDFLMPDAGRVGGLSELRRIAVLAEGTATQVSPHNFSSGVLLAATLQVMAVTPNARYLEMDNSGNAAYDEVLEEPLHPVEGMVKVPSYPGFGVRLPQDLVDKQATTHSFSVGHAR